MNCPYLKITLHDNDFTPYWKLVAGTVYNTLLWSRSDEESFLEEKDLEIIRLPIVNIWYSIYCLINKDETDNFEHIKQYIIKNIEIQIVDFLDISWDNANFEDIYVPIFENSTVDNCLLV